MHSLWLRKCSRVLRTRSLQPAQHSAQLCLRRLPPCLLARVRPQPQRRLVALATRAGEKCGLAARTRARCPSPPRVFRFESDATERGPWGEGVPPSHAPLGAVVRAAHACPPNQRVCRRVRGRDALAPKRRFNAQGAGRFGFRAFPPALHRGRWRTRPSRRTGPLSPFLVRGPTPAATRCQRLRRAPHAMP